MNCFKKTFGWRRCTGKYNPSFLYPLQNLRYDRNAIFKSWKTYKWKEQATAINRQKIPVHLWKAGEKVLSKMQSINSCSQKYLWKWKKERKHESLLRPSSEFQRLSDKSRRTDNIKAKTKLINFRYSHRVQSSTIFI